MSKVKQLKKFISKKNLKRLKKGLKYFKKVYFRTKKSKNFKKFVAQTKPRPKINRVIFNPATIYNSSAYLNTANKYQSLLNTNTLIKPVKRGRPKLPRRTLSQIKKDLAKSSSINKLYDYWIKKAFNYNLEALIGGKRTGNSLIFAYDKPIEKIREEFKNKLADRLLSNLNKKTLAKLEKAKAKDYNIIINSLYYKLTPKSHEKLNSYVFSKLYNNELMDAIDTNQFLEFFNGRTTLKNPEFLLKNYIYNNYSALPRFAYKIFQDFLQINFYETEDGEEKEYKNFIEHETAVSYLNTIQNYDYTNAPEEVLELRDAVLDYYRDKGIDYQRLFKIMEKIGIKHKKLNFSDIQNKLNERLQKYGK